MEEIKVCMMIGLGGWTPLIISLAKEALKQQAKPLYRFVVYSIQCNPYCLPFPMLRGQHIPQNSFQPEGRGFDSRYSHHVGTLGKSFTYSCLCASA